MLKTKFILNFLTLIGLVFAVNAKENKPDQILIVQNLINNAYTLGYVDAAPVEMDFIEKKVIKAMEAKKSKKKKLYSNLITEIKADLKIVKQRYKVNELYQELFNLEQTNLQSKKMLDELKVQL